MQANLGAIKKQHFAVNEIVLAKIRCSLEVFIYRQVSRPGLLVATDKKVIFVADSVEGNELTEIFDYEKLLDIRGNKGIWNRSISMKYDNDKIKFNQLMSDNPEEFINVVKSKLF